MKIILCFFTLAALLSLSSCSAQMRRPSTMKPVAAKSCSGLRDGAKSTFVMYEVRTATLSACNAERATYRFVPGSTFKIPHALIAAKSGVVADGEMFKWDGRARGLDPWNKDSSFADAIKNSTVWVFQQIATRLGYTRLDGGVRAFRYGNADIGSEADLRHFWLWGPLRTSAIEQVDFLKRLESGDMPVADATQKRVMEMFRIADCGSGCVIYGKTGVVLPIDDEGFFRPNDTLMLPAGVERVGWFVGWVDRSEAKGGPVVFAHNLDLSLPDAMNQRQKASYALLQANGVIDQLP